MTEHKINEMFFDYGTELKAVGVDETMIGICPMCFYHPLTKEQCMKIKCTSKERADKTDVIFIEQTKTE